MWEIVKRGLISANVHHNEIRIVILVGILKELHPRIVRIKPVTEDRNPM